MSKLILILVAGGFILYGVTNITLNQNVVRGSENSYDNYSYNQARNIAASVAEMALSQLADSSSWRVNTPTTMSIFGGSAVYTVVDTISGSPIVSIQTPSFSPNMVFGGWDGGQQQSDQNKEHNNGSNNNGNGNGYGNGYQNNGYGYGNGNGNGNSYGYGNGYNNEDSEKDKDKKDNDGKHKDSGHENDEGHGHGNDHHHGHGGNGGNGNGGNGNGGNGNGGNGGSGGGTNPPAANNSYVKITVNGTYMDVTKTVVVYAQFNTGGSTVPSSIKASITTNGSTNTNGNLTVDGRDHDTNGTLLATGGMPGIYSTGNVQQKSQSQIGGTFNGVDYAPSMPAAVGIVDAKQTWSGTYPTTPDEVMGGTGGGFPSGTLKTYAQSGKNGSQYVTSSNGLTFPLSGVTYVELPANGSLSNINLSGSGILIVHNTSGNAVISGINSGTFSGLIITDDISGLNGTVIGGIFTLNSGNSTLGSGSGSLLYSNKAIQNAVGLFSTSSPKAAYGAAGKRLSVVRWQG